MTRPSEYLSKVGFCCAISVHYTDSDDSIKLQSMRELSKVAARLCDLPNRARSHLRVNGAGSESNQMPFDELPVPLNGSRHLDLHKSVKSPSK